MNGWQLTEDKKFYSLQVANGCTNRLVNKKIQICFDTSVKTDAKHSKQVLSNTCNVIHEENDFDVDVHETAESGNTGNDSDESDSNYSFLNYRNHKKFDMSNFDISFAILFRRLLCHRSECHAVDKKSEENRMTLDQVIIVQCSYSTFPWWPIPTGFKFNV